MRRPGDAWQAACCLITQPVCQLQRLVPSCSSSSSEAQPARTASSRVCADHSNQPRQARRCRGHAPVLVAAALAILLLLASLGSADAVPTQCRVKPPVCPSRSEALARRPRFDEDAVSQQQQQQQQQQQRHDVTVEAGSKAAADKLEAGSHSSSWVPRMSHEAAVSLLTGMASRKERLFVPGSSSQGVPGAAASAARGTQRVMPTANLPQLSQQKQDEALSQLVSALQGDSSSSSTSTPAAAGPAAPQQASSNSSMLFLDNARLRVGLDTQCGGAITYVSSAVMPPEWANVNLVNTWDAGRLIQQSYYGCYDNTCWVDRPWRWNPVQAGSWQNGPPRLLASSLGAASATVASVPRNWGGQQLIDDVMMITETELHPNVAKVRFTMRYTGEASHPDAHQEVPAVFVNRRLNVLALYTGSKPWSGGDLTFIMPGQVGEYYRPTERWAAYVDQLSGFGLGVYTPIANQVVAYRIGPENSTARNDVSYMAPLVTASIQPNTEFSYDAYIAVGRVDEMRGWFAEIAARVAPKNEAGAYKRPISTASKPGRADSSTVAGRPAAAARVPSLLVGGAQSPAVARPLPPAAIKLTPKPGAKHVAKPAGSNAHKHKEAGSRPTTKPAAPAAAPAPGPAAAPAPAQHKDAPKPTQQEQQKPNTQPKQPPAAAASKLQAASEAPQAGLEVTPVAAPKASQQHSEVHTASVASAQQQRAPGWETATAVLAGVEDDEVLFDGFELAPDMAAQVVRHGTQEQQQQQHAAPMQQAEVLKVARHEARVSDAQEPQEVALDGGSDAAAAAAQQQHQHRHKQRRHHHSDGGKHGPTHDGDAALAGDAGGEGGEGGDADATSGEHTTAKQHHRGHRHGAHTDNNGKRVVRVRKRRASTSAASKGDATGAVTTSPQALEGDAKQRADNTKSPGGSAAGKKQTAAVSPPAADSPAPAAEQHSAASGNTNSSSSSSSSTTPSASSATPHPANQHRATTTTTTTPSTASTPSTTSTPTSTQLQASSGTDNAEIGQGQLQSDGSAPPPAVEAEPSKQGSKTSEATTTGSEDAGEAQEDSSSSEEVWTPTQSTHKQQQHHSTATEQKKQRWPAWKQWTKAFSNVVAALQGKDLAPNCQDQPAGSLCV